MAEYHNSWENWEADLYETVSFGNLKDNKIRPTRYHPRTISMYQRTQSIPRTLDGTVQRKVFAAVVSPHTTAHHIKTETRDATLRNGSIALSSRGKRGTGTRVAKVQVRGSELLQDALTRPGGQDTQHPRVIACPHPDMNMARQISKISPARFRPDTTSPSTSCTRSVARSRILSRR